MNKTLHIIHRTVRAAQRLALDNRGQDFVEYALMTAFAVSVAGYMFPAMVASNSAFQRIYTVVLSALSTTLSLYGGNN